MVLQTFLKSVLLVIPIAFQFYAIYCWLKNVGQLAKGHWKPLSKKWPYLSFIYDFVCFRKNYEKTVFHQERPFLSMYEQHVRNCMKLLGALESTFTGLSIRLTMRCILVVVVHGVIIGVCWSAAAESLRVRLRRMSGRGQSAQHQRTRKAAFSLLMSEFFPQAHKNPHTTDMTHSTTC